MANNIVSEYAAYLEQKFPKCKVEIVELPAKETTIVGVTWREGNDWFDMPCLFHKDFTQEAMANVKHELDIWEEEIGERLRNKGRLPLK